MQLVTFSSGLSQVADPLARQLGDHLSETLGLRVRWIDDRPREGWLRETRTDLLWACGYLHASNLETGRWHYEAVVAPVMAAERYGGQPVYFGDVIVRSDDLEQTLPAVARRRFAYNEVESFSGYEMLRRSQLMDDEVRSRLSAGIRTGSHAASISAVIDGSADWAVIDSTVLDMQARREIRVVTSIGPYPAPPILVSRTCPDPLRLRLIGALRRLHADETARALLNRWNVASFVEIEDRDYRSLLTAG